MLDITASGKYNVCQACQQVGSTKRIYKGPLPRSSGWNTEVLMVLLAESTSM